MIAPPAVRRMAARIVRDLRPHYCAVQPVGEDEMIDAVRSALGEPERREA